MPLENLVKSKKSFLSRKYTRISPLHLPIKGEIIHSSGNQSGLHLASDLRLPQDAQREGGSD